MSKRTLIVSALVSTAAAIMAASNPASAMPIPGAIAIDVGGGCRIIITVAPLIRRRGLIVHAAIRPTTRLPARSSDPMACGISALRA
jgi:hypothetical protein